MRINLNFHIKALVKLVDSNSANYFAKSPTDSFPTILTVDKESFSSQVLLGEGTQTKPDSELEVEFKFLVPEEAVKRMTLGTEFSIWEQKYVGNGRVIEIVTR